MKVFCTIMSLRGTKCRGNPPKGFHLSEVLGCVINVIEKEEI